MAATVADDGPTTSNAWEVIMADNSDTSAGFTQNFTAYALCASAGLSGAARDHLSSSATAGRLAADLAAVRAAHR